MNKYCKCVYDYEAGDDDELTFAEGDVIEVINDSDEGWWIGILKGRKGTFPSNFVESMPLEEARSALGLPPLTSDTAPKYSAPKRKSSLRVIPTQPVEVARADYDYTSQDGDELSFKEGDVVEIVNKFPGTEGWWQVKNAAGKVGLVPDNFFTINTPSRKAGGQATNQVPPTLSESIEQSSEANAALAAVTKAAATLARGNLPRSASALATLPSSSGPSSSAPSPPATQDWRANLKKRNAAKPPPSATPTEEKSESNVPPWLKKRKEEAEKVEKKEEPLPAIPSSSNRTRQNSGSVLLPSPSKPAVPGPSTGASMRRSKPGVGGKPGPSEGRQPSSVPPTLVPKSEPSKSSPAPTTLVPKSEPSKSSPAPMQDGPSSSTASCSEAGALSAAAAEQLKKLNDMVLDLEKQVKSLTTSMKTMQGTIHNLESEVDSEKKLRSSCEVELQRIRQKLNTKEMDSI